MQMRVGPMPHAAIMRSIELFGTVVAPAVREAMARKEGLAAWPSAAELLVPQHRAQEAGQADSAKRINTTSRMWVMRSPS